MDDESEITTTQERSERPPDTAPAPVEPEEPRRSVVAQCSWELANPVTDTSYTFHGAQPWRTMNDPRSSECCTLSSSTIACIVVDHESRGLRTDQGVIGLNFSVEHLRLFDPNAATPWLDLIVSVAPQGPMAPSSSAPPNALVFDSHVDVDASGLRVMGGEGSCGANQIRCTEADGPAFDCGAYRAQLATLRKRFCDARGTYAWRGNRLVRVRP